MKKVFLLWCCIFPAIYGIALYKQVILAQLTVGFFSFLSGLFILFLQTDIKQYKKFSLYLFIGAVIGYVGSSLRYLGPDSNDAASQVILFVVVLVGLAIVAIQILIGYFISKSMKRNKVSE